MKKTLLLYLAITHLVFSIGAAEITITEAAGWLESAYLIWEPLADADSYNVYYSGEGEVNKKIDDYLIRDYGSYFRADIPGIKPGSYSIKVAAVVKGTESATAQTGSLTVSAFDRSGFAFANGRVPGAYKADGRPKDGAVILYITEANKNIVSMNVTGANSNPCVGLQEILDGFKKGNDVRPLIVRFVGQITDFSYMLNGDIVIENKNNANSYITLEGVGNDAVTDGWGIRIKNAANIEIRNIATMNCDSGEGDNIGLQQNNDHVWVHHCDFFYGHAGSDGDQAKGDGALDVKGSRYITLSYNHFWDTGKSNLLGLGESLSNPGLYITYHHNWYDHSDSRHPRVRYYSTHVYNNFYDGIAKYGIGATEGASVFVEGNYFRKCKYPMLISLQGSDISGGGGGTFSGEDGGIIKAFNNHIEGAQRFVPYGDAGFANSNTQFDAYVVNNRNDKVPSSLITFQGGHRYNNFDTDVSLMYSYSLQSPEEAKATVMQFAGRMFGGDFSWTFNNELDDSSYDVNPALKAALTSYSTTLVAVQGETANSEPGDGEPGSGEPGEVVEGDMLHNFTLSGLNSTFYNFTGNLSDSKGTVTYNSLTMNICLKIESSTSIKFTLERPATVTLVFNDGFSGKIKFNGTDYNISGGVLQVTLEAGSHEILKNSTANLYYISAVYDSPVGMDKTDDSESMYVYPNPVSESLHLSSYDGVKKVEIYSISGVLIKSVKANSAGIELSNLNTGSYLVLIHKQGEIVKQIVIKK